MYSYFTIDPLSPNEYSDFLSGRKGGDDDEEEGEEGGAVGGSGATPAGAAAATTTAAAAKPQGTLTIADFLTVPCTGEAVAAGFAGVLWGGSSNPVAAEVEGLRSGAAGAVASLHKALLTNATYIRTTLKRPFLPDCAAARASNAPILGSQSDTVAGCRVTVTITRAAPCVPPSAVAAVVGAVGGGGGAKDGGAGEAALSAIHSSALPPLLPPNPPTTYRLVGGVSVTLQEGVHFFASPELAIATMSQEEAKAGGLPEGWLGVCKAMK